MAITLIVKVRLSAHGLCMALQVCHAVHEPGVAVRQLLGMLAAGVAAGPGGVAGLFKLLDGEGVRVCVHCVRVGALGN